MRWRLEVSLFKPPQLVVLGVILVMFGIQGNELAVLTEFGLEEFDPPSQHTPAEEQNKDLQSGNRQHHQNGNDCRLIDRQLLAVL